MRLSFAFVCFLACTFPVGRADADTEGTASSATSVVVEIAVPSVTRTGFPKGPDFVIPASADAAGPHSAWVPYEIQTNSPVAVYLLDGSTLEQISEARPGTAYAAQVVKNSRAVRRHPLVAAFDVRIFADREVTTVGEPPRSLLIASPGTYRGRIEIRLKSPPPPAVQGAYRGSLALRVEPITIPSDR